MVVDWVREREREKKEMAKRKGGKIITKLKTGNYSTVDANMYIYFINSQCAAIESKRTVRFLFLLLFNFRMKEQAIVERNSIQNRRNAIHLFSVFSAFRRSCAFIHFRPVNSLFLGLFIYLLICLYICRCLFQFGIRFERVSSDLNIWILSYLLGKFSQKSYLF